MGDVRGEGGGSGGGGGKIGRMDGVVYSSAWSLGECIKASQPQSAFKTGINVV